VRRNLAQEKSEQQAQNYRNLQMKNLQRQMNTPAARKIIQQGGISYYADNGQPVLPGAVDPKREQEIREKLRASNRGIRVADTIAATPPGQRPNFSTIPGHDPVKLMEIQEQYNKSYPKAKEGKYETINYWKDDVKQPPVRVLAENANTMREAIGQQSGVTWEKAPAKSDIEKAIASSGVTDKDKIAEYYRKLLVRKTSPETIVNLPPGMELSGDGALRPIPGFIPKRDVGEAELFHNRAVDADATLTSLEGKYNRGQLAAKEGVGRVWGVGGALEAAGNIAMGENEQLVEQAKRNFINATLRRESGAAIAESEFANAEKQYFPQVGDGEKVVLAKAQNRRRAIAAFGKMGGVPLESKTNIIKVTNPDTNQEETWDLKTETRVQ